MPAGRKFMRMELPGNKNPSGRISTSGRPSPSGRTSPNKDISVEKEEKLEVKSVDSLEAEDSVPAGWKMAKFGSDLDILLTSPQVIENPLLLFDLFDQIFPQGKLFLSRQAALEWMVS